MKPAYTLSSDPQPAGRINFRAATNISPMPANIFLIPPPKDLLKQEAYARTAGVASAADQPTLLYAAVLASSYLSQRMFAEAADLLGRLHITALEQWTFDKGDDMSQTMEVADISPSNASLTAYLIGARAYARMQATTLDNRALWMELANYQASKLNRPGFRGGWLV